MNKMLILLQERFNFLFIIWLYLRDFFGYFLHSFEMPKKNAQKIYIYLYIYISLGEFVWIISFYFYSVQWYKKMQTISATKGPSLHVTDFLLLYLLCLKSHLNVFTIMWERNPTCGSCRSSLSDSARMNQITEATPALTLQKRERKRAKEIRSKVIRFTSLPCHREDWQLSTSIAATIFLKLDSKKQPEVSSQ